MTSGVKVSEMFLFSSRVMRIGIRSQITLLALARFTGKYSLLQGLYQNNKMTKKCHETWFGKLGKNIRRTTVLTSNQKHSLCLIDPVAKV